MPMSDYLRELRALVGNRVLEVPTVGVVVLDDAARMLLVRHAEGNDWTTPGGMVEPGETPADAAVRETWEETGLIVEPTRVLAVLGGPLHAATYANGDRVTWVSTLFAARAVGGALRADGEEALEVRYCTQAEAAALRCKPHMAAVLDVAWRGVPAAHFVPATWHPPRT